jgi:hypothetical protein
LIPFIYPNAIFNCLSNIGDIPNNIGVPPIPTSFNIERASIRLLHIFLFFCTTYIRYLLQFLDALENCGFVWWVDPTPLHPHEEYIYYLQNRVFVLEREVNSSNKNDKEDDIRNGASSHEVSCTNPYCNYSYYRNKMPPSPPPPSSAMGGYYG